MTDHNWSLKQQLLERITENGDWVNAHAHFDRAYTVTPENFELTQIHYKKKWKLNAEISKNSSPDEVFERMDKAVQKMVDQGVQAVGTFIDIDPWTKDKTIQAAKKVRKKYQGKVELKFINQTLHGVIEPEAREWFETAADFVDIIGGLPSKDAGKEAEHLDILMQAAKSRDKMVHVHVDQNNDPAEKETELLIKKTQEYGLEGRVVAIHSISLAAQPKSYREKIYKQMKEAGIMVIANPTAYIDHARKETTMPFHNAVTPVDELVPHGITVALGTDNIADLHKPFTDGDMWTELRFLLESCRFFDLDSLVTIATDNGRKVLGLT